MCPPVATPRGIIMALDGGVAIRFALDKLEPFEVTEFLSDWRKKDFRSWPEYLDFAARLSVEEVVKNAA